MKTGHIGYKIGKQVVPASTLKNKEWESECVSSLQYDPETEQATCHFMQRGSYVYYAVPPDVFMEWNNAGSRGTYLNLYIKGNYSYEKV